MSPNQKICSPSESKLIMISWDQPNTWLRGTISMRMTKWSKSRQNQCVTKPEDLLALGIEADYDFLGPTKYMVEGYHFNEDDEIE